MSEITIQVPLLHFGTDGVRGLANSELTPELALRLGQAAAGFLRSQKADGPVVIGRDTRRSCSLLEDALAAGICSAGVDVIRLGVIPTPAVAFLVESFEGCGGVVISASHNPAPYNGIKFFDFRGYKLSEQAEATIEAELLRPQVDRPTGPAVGVSTHAADAVDRYIDHLRHSAPVRLKGMKIALDCANGATTAVAPRIFRLLGADVHVIGNRPDGININLDSGSTYPQRLIQIIKDGKFDLGFAFDGDGDRVIAVDNEGTEVDGDVIMAICADHLHNCGELPRNTVVTTVMTNLGFDIAMKNKGIKVTKTNVGDRYVLEEMLKSGAVLGGEQSGHIIYHRHATTGDGLVSALQLLRAVCETGRPLSELSQVMKRLPQRLLNVSVKGKIAKNGDFIGSNPALGDAVGKAEAELGSTGRILVRPSGTEPLVRVMVEAESEELANAIAERVAGVVSSEIG